MRSKDVAVFRSPTSTCAFSGSVSPGQKLRGYVPGEGPRVEAITTVPSVRQCVIFVFFVP